MSDESPEWAMERMDFGGEVLVGQLRSTVAGGDVGSVADRCLLSGVNRRPVSRGRHDRFWSVA
jgi:hypothetical protein